jgi:ABC-type nitrate/sulfonate/bicarbonate transport system ATPase subunit
MIQIRSASFIASSISCVTKIALAAEQDIILMDEPFGALDPITRDTLQDLVKDLRPYHVSRK